MGRPTGLHVRGSHSHKGGGHHRSSKRPAFLLQGPIMLGIMLLGFVVYVGVMSAFLGVIQANIVESITEVPTMYSYHPDTGARISDVPPAVLSAAEPLLAERDALRAEVALLSEYVVAGDGSRSFPNYDYGAMQAAEAEIDRINSELAAMGWVDESAAVIGLYRFFAVPATILLVLMMVFAAAGHFMERGLGLWRLGGAAGMFRGAVLGIMAIWLMPEVWDAFAIFMTGISLDMMRLGGDTPQAVVDGLWCKMGASAGCMFDFAGVLDPLKWATALTSPADFGQTLMGEVLLPFFMLTPALSVSLVMYIMGEVRILFISIALVTFPLWLVFRHLPVIDRHAADILASMVGASIAPFFSALTLAVGWEYVSNTTLRSLEEWIAVLGIISLAGAWPLMLAGFLGRVSGGVTGAVQGAVTSSSMMASQMGTGMAMGAMASAQQGQSAAGVMGGALMGGGSSMIGQIPNAPDALSTGKRLGLETGPLITAPGGAASSLSSSSSPSPGAGAGGASAAVAAGAAGAALPSAGFEWLPGAAGGSGLGGRADDAAAGVQGTLPAGYGRGASSPALDGAGAAGSSGT